MEDVEHQPCILIQPFYRFSPLPARGDGVRNKGLVFMRLAEGNT